MRELGDELWVRSPRDMGGCGLDGDETPGSFLTTPSGPQTQVSPGPGLVAAKKVSLPFVLTHDINLSPRTAGAALPPPHGGR